MKVIHDTNEHGQRDRKRETETSRIQREMKKVRRVCPTAKDAVKELFVTSYKFV